MGFLSLQFLLGGCFVFLSLSCCVGNYVITTIAGTGTDGYSGLGTMESFQITVVAIIQISVSVRKYVMSVLSAWDLYVLIQMVDVGSGKVMH